LHHQFALVGVGEAEVEAAVGKHLALLVGVPAFLSHPGGDLAGEAAHRLFFRVAGKDSEGGGEEGARLVVADIVADGFQGDVIAHPFQGEACGYCLEHVFLEQPEKISLLTV
jgi:hypothetical protein